MSTEIRLFIAQFVEVFYELLVYAIFARVILSFFRPMGGAVGKVSQFINDITDPIILPIKKIMPRTGMIDLSPFIAVIIIELLHYLIISVL